MYTTLDVDEAIKKAECKDNKIYCDRKAYIEFYEIAERYVHDHDLFIDGNIGIKLLLYQEMTLKDIEYIIISKTPKIDAYNIADLIYKSNPTGLGQYTNVLSEALDIKYTIRVNQRILFTIKSFGIVKEVEIFDILRPITRPALYAKDNVGMINLNIYSTDLQLINIYNKLTNPILVSDYNDLIEYESLISKQFIICHTSEKKGGSIPNKQNYNVNTKNIIEELLNKFIPRHGHVLVGNYGIIALKNNLSIDKLKYSENCRLQIISSNSFTEEKQFIIDLVNKLNCRTFSIINDPSIPSDDQLRKMTFYIDRKNGQREVLIDIFNSANYQLIPHNNHIGTVFIIMKYILIDFWILQLLYKMEYSKAHTTLVQLSNLINQYKNIQQIYCNIMEKKQYSQIFKTEPSSYIGYYIDEVIQSKRRMIGVKTGPNKPYYPCES